MSVMRFKYPLLYRQRAPDPLPFSPGPLLALDAALPDVAPLPLGDGQGEVQQELPGGGGRRRRGSPLFPVSAVPVPCLNR